MHSLKVTLKEWTDIDIAIHQLFLQLDLVEDNFPKYKSLYWSNSELSNTAQSILKELAKIGVLEFNEDENQFRANKNFTIQK